MCGIAAVYNLSKNSSSKKELKSIISSMIDIIDHRGPDDAGVFANSNIGLGSRRLSILDLSDSGHMPMVDKKTGNCIVHNGEVYNYLELKRSLGLNDVISNTDTEVILNAYIKLGKSCVHEFNGMFAFVIWDAQNKKLFMARDRLGIKPLFYAKYKNKIYFSSEIKSILKAGIPFEPDMDIIYDYLVYGVYDHSEKTFFKNIKQIPAGYTLELNNNNFKLEKYWDLDPDLEININEKSKSEFNNFRTTENFIDLLSDSLQLRLRSDVPIAVHISGGLDSSVMLSGINSVLGGQKNLRAFSYYYGEDKYDEKKYAEEIIKNGNWEAEFYRFDANDVPDLTKKAMWFQEQPFPGIITLAKHKLISKSKDYGAKVILEGQGGDDIGAGYQYVFASHVLDLIESGNSDMAITELNNFGKINGYNAKENMGNFVNSLASYYNTGYSADGSSFLKHNCINTDFINEHKHDLSFPKPFNSHLLNMQYRDTRFTKLPRILRSCDRASMASSRELRVPFLDHRLVELMFFLPGGEKIKNGVQRVFMRDAIKNTFPKWVTSSPKKTVVDPQREWLRTDLSEWVSDILHSSSFNDLGILDINNVKEEYENYKNTTNPKNSFFLWQWINICIWYETFNNN